MGWAVCQWYVVVAPETFRDVSSPLETAVRPRGTVAVRLYVALSLGWSLPGNQAIDPTGSPSATDPSAVLSQPSFDPSGSVRVSGEPE